MTPMNDAGREAFEALQRANGKDDYALRQVCGAYFDDEVFRDWELFEAAFAAGAAHARQPGEPVAWVKAALGALTAYEDYLGEPLPDSFDLGRIEESPGSSSFRIRVGHIRQLASLAHPAPPAPVAVPEGWVLVPREPTYEKQAELARFWGYTMEEAGETYATILDVFDGAAPSPASPEKGDGVLPCDVRLPPNTCITKGCKVSTLMLAIQQREGKDVSFAAPEKGTERMQEAMCAMEAWNSRADAANQWDALGGDEREDIIAIWESGYAAARNDYRGTPALASLPAEPEGETFPYQKTFDAIAAATSICGGHVSISVQAFREAFGATHPTTPKPAEVRVKGLEWADHPADGSTLFDTRGRKSRRRALFPWGAYFIAEGTGIGGAPHFYASSSHDNFTADGDSIEEMEEAAQADLARRVQAWISPAPAAEEFRRGAEADVWSRIGDAVDDVRQVIDAQQKRSDRIANAIDTVIANLKRTKDYDDTVPAIIKWWEEEEMPRIRAIPLTSGEG